MRIISSALLFLFGLLLSAQDHDSLVRITGQLVDAETLDGIEYVNIGIQNTPVGGISGLNGCFDLELDLIKYMDSSILISAIGYEPVLLEIERIDLNDSLIVYLQPQIYHIDEIVFEGKRLKLKNYGIKGGGDGIIRGMLHGLEKAYFIPVKKDIIKIRDVNFCLRSGFDTVTYRINFYEHKDKAPAKRISMENLIFSQVSDEAGWIKCDLSGHQLIFESDFFIAVELLPEIKNNKEVRATFKAKLGAKGKLFTRDYLDSWMEFKGLGIPININYYQIDR